MTQEDWKLLLPFVQAGADGKRIEARYQNDRPWMDFEAKTMMGLVSSGNVRIAPEPTFVQWTDDEVPLDAWYRAKTKPYDWFKITSRFFHEGHERTRYRLSSPIDMSPDVEGLFRDAEHSTDGCKTWKRCGKEVVK